MAGRPHLNAIRPGFCCRPRKTVSTFVCISFDQETVQTVVVLVIYSELDVGDNETDGEFTWLIRR